jgi:hypothetical protein
LDIKEQRTYKRIRVNLPVIYSYFGEYKVNADKGTTADISDSGMSFYTDKPLKAGLTLDVQIPHFWDVPRICTVRWNSMKSLNYFRVGVSFDNTKLY